ncbi:prostaglandin F2 receptor negative regulator [Megalops cyprinoides]|uniref:prostaglandin F2 receptor negative regulator n=1 Tax=Megalops cyprinoides TaxID=118141 RepID=UPI001864F606|nr:prostaglandin F2 receptor negative regulator [Megalops cyprinoides]
MKNTVFVYFVLFLMLGLSQGRVVKVAQGPLTRVVGQPVSLRCDVSDYDGPLEQDFEWQLLRGDQWLKIISTFDVTFTDPSLQERVDSHDIAMERLGDSAVELRIRSARAEDSAIYRCSTPSTDTEISGNYEAEVQLRVIGDSLKVAPSAPPAVVPEGSPFSLRCNATQNSSERTHLSVTWSLRKGASSEDILTFGPDGKVTVGSSFAQRYTDGGLRLHPRGDGEFGLVLTEALPADQGVYVCTAGVWVQEGAKVWQKIQEKKVEMGEVRVTPTAQSMTVTVEDNTTLSVAETLNLTCTVAADDLDAVSLEVAWLVVPSAGAGSMGPQVLVQMGRDGVVPDGSELVGVSRVEAGSFRLAMRGVERSDSGLYSCRVRAWIQKSSGEWYQAAEKTSIPVQVLVTLIEPDFRVTLGSIVTPKFSGDPTELDCSVTDVSRLGEGRLGVSWHYTETTPSDAPTSTHAIAALDEQGNLQLWDEYRERAEKGHLALSRVKPDTFKLRLLHTRDSDRGAYSCTVSAWTYSQKGGWKKSKDVRSDRLDIAWSSKNPSLGVVARRLRETSSAGSTFEMSCQVIGQNLQNPEYSVLIQVEKTVGGPTRKILSLSKDSILQLEDWKESGRLDSVVLEKTGSREFRFRLYGAQVSDRGFYFCDVSAWTRGPGSGNDWTKAISAESNKIEISFPETGPSFNVSIRSDTTNVFPGETAKMQCDVTILGPTPNADDVSYEVKWFLSRSLGSESAFLLASMDRWGTVRKSPRNSSSDCSLERTDGRSFGLSIHSTQDSDSGQYHCTATPWLRSPDGAWTRGHDLTSGTVFLTVNLALWDSMKQPLLYGAGASLAVGLLSVLLGLICARCCYRRSLHTPLDVHMEMD